MFEDSVLHASISSEERVGGILGSFGVLLGVSWATFGGSSVSLRRPLGASLVAVGRRWSLPTATGLWWACCLPCVSKSGLETHDFSVHFHIFMMSQLETSSLSRIRMTSQLKT